MISGFVSSSSLITSAGIDKSHNERSIQGIYDAIDLGFNYRMAEINAAIGIEQLKKLNQFLKIRKRNFNIYAKRFENTKQISFGNHFYLQSFHTNIKHQIRKHNCGTQN